VSNGDRRTEGFAVEVLDRADAFAGLAAEWAKLAEACPSATPFQAHAWLDSWWRSYGRAGGLRVVLVRDGDGRLVAAAPLHLRRRGPVRVLAPLGGEITDFTDVLRDPSVPGAAAALAGALAELPGWDVLDLPEVRPGAATEALAAAWTGPCWSLESSPCTELRATSFDELLAPLSKKRASELRRRIRRADELGIELREVPGARAEQGVADLLRLHAEQWAGRGVTPEHLRPRFARHLTGALSRMICDGEAVLTAFWRDGELLASTLDLQSPDMVCGYLMGVSPAFYELTDVTTYVLFNELRRMEQSGRTTLNMLRGREGYKDHWRPVVVPNRRLLLARPGAPAAHPYGAAVRARARAVDIAREKAPQLRVVRSRLRTTRTRRSK
jgi:CelD/BcsL family acetyltransferase involved in cellulose biosynthesis